MESKWVSHFRSIYIATISSIQLRATYPARATNKQTNALNKQTMALKFQKKDENETNVLMPVYINAAMAPMNPVPMTECT